MYIINQYLLQNNNKNNIYKECLKYLNISESNNTSFDHKSSHQVTMNNKKKKTKKGI